MGESMNGKLVAGLLVGAAIGGALGVLFAPDKGSVTRSNLWSKGGDIKNAVKDKVSKFQDAAQKANSVASDQKA